MSRQTPQKPFVRSQFRRAATMRAASSGLALVCALAVAPASVAPAVGAAPAPATCKATPFRTDAAKNVVYRIPAMVSTKKGTLLAFAERRRSTTSASDVSDIEIVLARSTDRGCHWSTPKVIADKGSDTIGNPVPVVDTTTGTVMLFTVDRPPGVSTYHGLHLQRSNDDGLTFTPYSEAGKDLAKIPRWAGGLTGPGHAIQLHNANSPHPGRIVVPIGSYGGGTLFGAYAITSDDHGATWKVGFEEKGHDQRMEGTVAELRDGRLWTSFHTGGVNAPVGTGRISAMSSNGGTSLAAPFKNAGLPVISVQGSSLALTGTYAGTLLFSSPARKDVSARHQLGLFVSRGLTVGRTWSESYDVQLDSRPASYSDLVQIDDATIGVLYETGEASWHERIDFRSMKITDVIYRARVTPTVAVTVPNPLAVGRALNPSLVVSTPGTADPTGVFQVRLTGKNVNRPQTLPLYGNSGGKRVARLGQLAKGTYNLEVRYLGTSRIKPVWTNRTITVR